MKNLFYRLLIYLDSANEADTNYNIAWYMAHHISEVAHMGISKLASECFVSPATISRFCRTNLEPGTFLCPELHGIFGCT